MRSRYKNGPLPESLSADAYFTEDLSEWALPKSSALEYIEWCKESAYSILGFDVWRPTSPGPTAVITSAGNQSRGQADISALRAHPESDSDGLFVFNIWVKGNVTQLVAGVKEQWLKSGVNLRPGVSAEEIRSFEDSFGVRLSKEVSEYFQAADGMNLGDTDGHFIRFWPLAEVKPVIEELPNETNYGGYFLFADWSIWAHAYAFKPSTQAEDVVIVALDDPICVASSFEGFLREYLFRPDALFKPSKYK